MTDQLSRLREIVVAEIRDIEQTMREKGERISVLNDMLNHIDAIAAEHPVAASVETAPAGGRAARRDLQGAVLKAVDASPLALTRLHGRVVSALGGDVRESEIKRVLGALVGQHKVMTDGARWWLPDQPAQHAAN